MNHTEIEEREQEALNSLEDAKERIKQLEEDLRFWKGEYETGVGRVQIVERDLAKAQLDLADMTKLAVDYKEANTRLEDELREFHAKDGGRTREHNLLVQENRKMRDILLSAWSVLDECWHVVMEGECKEPLELEKQIHKVSDEIKSSLAKFGPTS